MDVREKFRQDSVPAERKDHSRRTEDVARHKAERGDGRASEKSGPSEIAEKSCRRLGEGRVFVIREIGAESSLRHNLDQDINDCRNDEREISRTRNGARGI